MERKEALDKVRGNGTKGLDWKDWHVSRLLPTAIWRTG